MLLRPGSGLLLCIFAFKNVITDLEKVSLKDYYSLLRMVRVTRPVCSPSPYIFANIDLDQVFSILFWVIMTIGADKLFSDLDGMSVCVYMLKTHMKEENDLNVNFQNSDTKVINNDTARRS